MKKTVLMLLLCALFGLSFAFKAADSVNLFALDLYKVLSEKDGNIFFSPFSLSTALAMTYLGAAGNTALQMKQVLHYDDENLHENFSSLIDSLSTPSKDCMLFVANALWLHKDHPALESFLQALEKYYRATAKIVDFEGDLKNSIRRINSWIEEKTQGKIKDMLSEGDINGLTRLIVTNAIYFKGKWSISFDPSRTKKDVFHLDEVRTVEIDMMNQTANFNYFENDQIQILELSYASSELSMIVVLPKEGVKLRQVEEALTLEKLQQWIASLCERQVDLWLPKFTFTQRLSLKRTLMKMGMIDAFTDAADFSKIDGTHMLKIQDVIHQAFVEVNEEGTEAAAATAVIIGIKMAPSFPVVFKADRPFLFFIRDKGSGTILFMGRLQKP